MGEPQSTAALHVLYTPTGLYLGDGRWVHKILAPLSACPTRSPVRRCRQDKFGAALGVFNIGAGGPERSPMQVGGPALHTPNSID